MAANPRSSELRFNHSMHLMHGASSATDIENPARQAARFQDAQAMYYVSGAAREAKRRGGNCRNGTINLYASYGWSEIGGRLRQNTAAFNGGGGINFAMAMRHNTVFWLATNDLRALPLRLYRSETRGPKLAKTGSATVCINATQI